MASGPATEQPGPSTRPYLLRALHDWCTDNGFTPYIAGYVDESVQVPREFVRNDEIVLNVGFEATSGLKLGNETIEFKARFGGVPREIVVPVDHVVAIYARENGQGMAFPMPAHGGAPHEPGTVPVAPAAQRGLRLALSDAAPAETPAGSPPPAAPEPPEPPEPTPGGRPSLKRIK
jgi:stringent starvation protein B